MARLFSRPPDTGGDTGHGPGTCSGSDLKSLLLVGVTPSWPDQLPPHVHTVPSVRTAMVCQPPASMETTASSPLTWYGPRRCSLASSMPTRCWCLTDVVRLVLGFGTGEWVAALPSHHRPFC